MKKVSARQAFCLTAGLVVSAAAYSASFNAQVTVAGAIGFNETLPLNFGTVAGTTIDATGGTDAAAIVGGVTPNDASYLVLGVDGSYTLTQGSNGSAMTAWNDGQLGELTVTLAAPNSLIYVTSPLMAGMSTAPTLITIAKPLATPVFRLSNLTFDISKGAVPADGIAEAVIGDQVGGQADGTGSMTIMVGGTLYTALTAATASTAYPASTLPNDYVGVYDVFVSY